MNQVNSSHTRMIRFHQQSTTCIVAAIAGCCLLVAGCSAQRKSSLNFDPECGPCAFQLQQIEVPDVCNECDDTTLMAGPPVTLENFQDQPAWELTLEQCVELALANSKVMQKVGGVVVASPVVATTLYDQAITETGNASVEAALSEFDTQLNTSFFYNHDEQKFNNAFFGGGAASVISDNTQFNFQLQKRSAVGTTFAVRNQIDYTRNNVPINRFPSAYNWLSQAEVRQPLWRGRGAEVNRIAGPNLLPGNYNGVMIARIRSDISLADFELAVRDLVREVERNYWELYFAWHDLNTKLAARDSAREVWANRKLRFENGIGRPDDEAQARQQYFSFQAQSESALAGVPNGQPGVLGADRTLRRLLGVAAGDGRIIRPVSEPSIAPVVLDWEQSKACLLDRRVELRRQRWTVQQRELELLASCQLNQWQLDMVSQLGARGFGDNLFGSRSRPEGSAFDDLLGGELGQWQVGFEMNGAIGRRRGHLAVRNAELNLVREKAILDEQKRQLVHDLNAAFTEVDRSIANIRTNFNFHIAVQEELSPRKKRVDAGQGPGSELFILLDTQQRAATAESNIHRSIATYNQALLTYDYTCGQLLRRYNIRLTEGPWASEAVTNADCQAGRYIRRGPNECDRDICPVSAGPYDQ